MELPENTGGTFEPCPQGTFAARCIRFIDMGSHEQTYQGESKGLKRLVLLSFELPTETMEDSRPFTISKRYTWSMHEKSNLRHDLESWRGKRFIDADFGEGGFDIKNVLGVPATITVTHNERDGNVYSNITSIGAMMKGVEISEQINPTVYVALTKERFDREAFDSLSDNLRGKIGSTPEYRALFSEPQQANGSYDESNPPPVGAPVDDFEDSEVPF